MIRWNGKNWIPAGVKPVIGRRRGAPVPGRPNARWVAGWIGGLGEAPPDVTPSSTPTPSITPTISITPSITPSPSFVLECHIEAQNGDFIIAQNGDYIDHFPCPDPSPTPSVTATVTTTPTPTPSSSAPAFDADAAAYLAEVIASGGTTNATISAATDTLFTSLKSAGLYSKLYTMYPMVGATASSHAINALGNKTYDLTYNGGITHNTSGSTGNGTNGWANTNFSNQTFAQDDYSFGFYQYTQNTTANLDEIIMGARGNTPYPFPILQIGTEINNTSYFFRSGGSSFTATANGGNNNGFFVGNRASSSSSELYRNGNTTPLLTQTNTYTKAGVDLPIALWNFTLTSTTVFSTGYANQGINFAFMGEGLTTTEMSNLATAINTFQTSLGRNTY